MIRAGAIGDTLMATPLLRSLRKSFPDSYIGAVTSTTAADVLRHNPHIDEVFPVAYRHLPTWLSLEKQRILARARKLRIDTVLSLEANPSFTKIACRTRAERIMTYDPSPLCPALHHLPNRDGEHSIEMHLRAGELVGAAPDGMAMEFFYPEGVDASLTDKLSSIGIAHDDRVIGIHAGWGSREQHPTNTRLRSWPADRFGQAARWLFDKYKAKIVLTGTEQDRPLNDFIATASGVPCHNLAGKFSLLESAALIRRMGLYITIDSGPAHMAAALGTPLITLWGPGIFTATRPIAGKGTVTILREPPECAPCYGTPLMKTCQNNICMKQIAVADVKAAAADILDAK